MTKADLVAQVAKKAGLTAKAAKEADNTIFSSMSDFYGTEKSGQKRTQSPNGC